MHYISLLNINNCSNLNIKNLRILNTYLIKVVAMQTTDTIRPQNMKQSITNHPVLVKSN